MNLITSRLLLIAVVSSPGISSYSQSDTLFYFFDKDGNTSPSKTAAYVGFGIREKGQIRFTNYTVPEGLPVMEGYFTDSTLAVKNGYYKSFDPPGYIEEEGVYKKNSKEDYWLHWNKNGQVEDSDFYQHGNLLLNIALVYNNFGVTVNRIATNDVQAKKEFTDWYDNGELKMATTWIDGDGEGYHYYNDGKLEGVDTYEKGKITKSVYYKKDGTLMTADETATIKRQELDKANRRFEEMQQASVKEPSFPGGNDGFWAFLNENMRIPSSIFNHLPDRSIKLSFMLNKEGHAEDIKIINNGSYDIRSSVVDVLSKMPNWNMKGLKSYGPLTYIFKLQGSLTQF
ncbi:MAG: hypothetical protein ABI480_18500 [Chitinophagaceae bacterium]